MRGLDDITCFVWPLSPALWPGPRLKPFSRGLMSKQDDVQTYRIWLSRRCRGILSSASAFHVVGRSEIDRRLPRCAFCRPVPRISGSTLKNRPAQIPTRRIFGRLRPHTTVGRMRMARTSQCRISSWIHMITGKRCRLRRPPPYRGRGQSGRAATLEHFVIL